ncbi:MAG: DNA recombination protein RmuC, partial [Actinomycetota bacterium]|nr:DNA recombination protein RmuC [Actinomycetota bacterium]
ATLADGRELALVVAPLREALRRVEGHLHELEAARTAAYASLTEQVSFVRESSEQLRSETSALVTALRAPQVRGRWGEMQLRRVVEMAGMVERCDFDEQPSTRSEAGVQRPDLVVRLAGGKRVVVDAKVALAAYLEAVESADADRRAERLTAHARQLRKHVESLSAKEYWSSFRPTPEFVVLFVPGEAFLAPALEHDPALLEDAMQRRVVVATPTTLLAMLRTIAYAWQQEAVSEHAREVLELGQELYRRLGTLGGHVDKLGRSLRRAVEDYNCTVGSLERSVFAPARRLAELDVTDRELVPAEPVDAAVRPLTATELIDPAGRVREETGDEDEGEPRLRLAEG